MRFFRSSKLKDRLNELGKEERAIAVVLDNLDENNIEDIDLAIKMGEKSYENTVELSKIHLELRNYDLYKISLMNLTKINNALFTLKKDREEMLLGCF